MDMQEYENEEVIFRHSNYYQSTGLYYQNGEDQSSSSESDGDNEKKPKYDSFKSITIEHSNTGSDRCYEVFATTLRALAYVVAFVLVLSSAVIAKGCILLMTSQIRQGKTTPYCNGNTGNLESYESVINPQERAQWIWALFFCFLTPEVWTLLRSLQFIIFKSFDMPTWESFFTVCIFESVHTIGIAILVFVALPELDVAKGAMLTNCLCIVPAILLLVSRFTRTKRRRVTVIALDVFAIVAQLSGLITWPFANSGSYTYAVWGIPLGIFFVSFAWWENFIDVSCTFYKETELRGQNKNLFVKAMKFLDNVRANLNQNRTRSIVYSAVSLWKILVFFCSMITLVYITTDGSHDDRLFIFKYFFSKEHRTVEVRLTNTTQRIYSNPHIDGSVSTFSASSSQQGDTTTSVDVDTMSAVYTFIIQACAAMLCYLVGKYACRVKIQGFSYAMPITLAVPLIISLSMALCGLKSIDVCFMKYALPRYLFWVCPSDDFFSVFIKEEFAWIWLLWFVSQIWVTVHIWSPKCERLASTDVIYVNPYYNAIFIDQSLSLNRRRNDGCIIKQDDEVDELLRMHATQTGSEDIQPSETEDELVRPPALDSVPRVIACTTMWHENSVEMLQTLKSIMKMDLDQFYRRLALKYFKIVDKDYYRFEANIFFDDAFRYEGENESIPLLNQYVEQLIRLVDEGAAKIYETGVRASAPVAFPTPYGGRLVWNLPGRTRLIAHLKDAKRIRHRKRWSQVMYMYYLLGFKLCNLPLTPITRLNTKAQNTFLLALDGDIEFNPRAVHLLVDLMKKNKKLGAACGRIHPVGSGLMAWYQKFEYAIGHWLQKATEHVIGCVLCSPGCFSLFRADALMQPNVMHTYTTRATKPRHYVQYDQGEDRWLCTLLLQQGYRVEYAAASDAYTHCPEAFKEFYQQRRRWVPSTMANILDLLGTAKDTIKINDNISILYIAYQWVLMVSSIIGPGTILLMLIGAMVAAFGIDIKTSMWCNIIPVLAFVLACLFTKQKFQIGLAGLLTCLYAILMMAVIVGILMEASVHGWLAPSSFFLLFTAGLMILTALFHPMEVTCIVCGVIYWVVIPSMYLLLIVYSAMNMNDVTWGVRENKNLKAIEERQAKESQKKKGFLGNTLDALKSKADIEEEGSLSCGCANLFSCQMCTYPKPDDGVKMMLAKQGDTLDVIIDMINRNMRRKSDIFGRLRRQSQDPFSSRRRSSTKLAKMKSIPEGDENEEENLTSEQQQQQQPQNSRISFNNDDEPDDDEYTDEEEESESSNESEVWLDNDLLQDQHHQIGVGSLTKKETRFWNYLIEHYLFPLQEDKEEKARISNELKKMRNQVAFVFFMLNALFVVMLLLMELHQDTLYIEYPDIGKYNISWTEDNSGGKTIWTVDVEQDMLRLEPIGFVFLLMFAVIMVIQFTAMLIHRFGTLSLIIATTELNLIGSKNDEAEGKLKTMSGHKIVKMINKNVTAAQEGIAPTSSLRRKSTVADTLNHLQMENNSAGRPIDLETSFKRKMTGIASNENSAEAQRLFSKFDANTAELVRRQSVAFHRNSIGSLGIGTNSSIHSRPSTSSRPSNRLSTSTMSSRRLSTMSSVSENGRHSIVSLRPTKPIGDEEC